MQFFLSFCFVSFLSAPTLLSPLSVVPMLLQQSLPDVHFLCSWTFLLPFLQVERPILHEHPQSQCSLISQTEVVSDMTSTFEPPGGYSHDNSALLRRLHFNLDKGRLLILFNFLWTRHNKKSISNQKRRKVRGTKKEDRNVKVFPYFPLLVVDAAAAGLVCCN